MTEKESPSEALAQATRLYSQAVRNRKMTRHRFFWGYAYDLFKHAPLYTHWQSLLTYFRRFRTIAFILRILTVIATVLQTGALVVLATAIFLVILPLLGALMLGILLTALLESRRTNRLLQKQAAGKCICVLFMSLEENGFLAGNAKSLAEQGFLVAIVSPYWIASKGIAGKRFFCTAREEYPNIFLIRRYYFFSFRKHVLQNTDAVYLY